jgi:hypothetical protein
MGNTGKTNSLWLRWTLNCAFGELMGIGLAGGIAYGVNLLIGEPETFVQKLSVLFFMLVAGAIEGTLLGFFQWRVLVGKFPGIPKNEWLFYTILVAVAGWFLGTLPSLFFIPSNPAGYQQSGTSFSVDFSHPFIFALLSVGTGLALGAVFGLFQCFSLRKYAQKAYSWIWANALGWGAALGWIYLFASIPTAQSRLLFTVTMGISGGLLAGLSVGGITGYYLLKLDQKHTRAISGQHS